MATGTIQSCLAEAAIDFFIYGQPLSDKGVLGAFFAHAAPYFAVHVFFQKGCEKGVWHACLRDIARAEVRGDSTIGDPNTLFLLRLTARGYVSACDELQQFQKYPNDPTFKRFAHPGRSL
jgi:hypothetical protein